MDKEVIAMLLEPLEVAKKNLQEFETKHVEIIKEHEKLKAAVLAASDDMKNLIAIARQ